MPSTRDKIGLIEPFADFRRFRSRGERRVMLLGTEELFRRRQQQVAPLDAIQLLALDQATRAREPAGSVARLATEQERKSEPERAANGARGLIRLQVSRVGAIESLVKLFVPAC